MHKVSVYLNNRASNTNIDYWKKLISAPLFRSEISFHSPVTLEELYTQLDLDLNNNISSIMTVGGDGTMNLVIQKLANKNVSYLAIPGGTANDLSNELNLVGDIKKAVQCIRNNEEKEIDLISINGSLMATNGGIGLGGEVVSKINEMRARSPMFKKIMKLSGKNIYTGFLASQFLKVSPVYYELELSCQEYSGVVKTPICLINNQPRLGGSFIVSPDTLNDDGLFNVTIFTHQDKISLMNCILKILRGNFPKNDKNLISFETRSLNIRSMNEANLKFFGDGEVLFDGVREFTINILPSALKVYSPCVWKNPANTSNEVFLQ